MSSRLPRTCPHPHHGHKRAVFVFAAFLLLTGGNARAQDPVATDRSALVALYNATDGANWTNNTNWLTEKALSEWHGVTTDEDGRVTMLEIFQNRLTGGIPAELGNLTKLGGLWLNRNGELRGPLPVGLRHLSSLEYLETQDTKVCAPRDAAFQTWLETISFAGLTCPPELESVIDVAVFYTAAARNARAGTAAIKSQIDLMIVETNQAYADSGVNQRLSLVAAQEVEYTEPDAVDAMRVNVTRLTGKSDGYMDTVHNVRDQVAADIVVLMVIMPPGSQCGGISNPMTGVSPASEDEAFAVIGAFCGARTFAHELGHIMGVVHDRHSELRCWRCLLPQFPYSYGYVNQRAFDEGAPDSARWYTIMAYENQCDATGFRCTPLLRFSNPIQTYLGDPLGVPGVYDSIDVTGPADAAHTLNRTRETVEQFRRVSGVTVSFGAVAYMAAEGGGAAAVTVRVSQVPGRPLVIPLKSRGASGASDDDYSVPAAVTISADETETTVDVTAVDDTEDDDGETVELWFGELLPSGVTVGSPDAATVTIADNDAAPRSPGGGGGGSGGGGGGGGPRTSAPVAPRNLTVVAGDGEVVLSWDPPEDDGGSAITDYEYRINRRNPWISIGSKNTTHTVTGLVNGTVYVFQVRAVNRIGKGRASNRAEATPEAPEVLDFAHFANGTGITSEMVLVNVAPRPIRPTIYFYDTEGALVSAESVMDFMGDLEVTEDGALTVWTEMEPLGELTISTHGQGELMSGSVRVVSDGPIAGFVRYSVPGVGVAGVGTSPPVRDALFPARRQAGGIRTAAALHNLGAEAIGVNCRLMSAGVALEEVEIPLEANGQTSWFIEDTFTTTDTSAFLGSVRCTAPGRGRFTAIAVEMDAAQRIFNTLSVVPLDRTGGRRGETVLDFAHFVNGTWITDLVFVNLETQPSGPAPTPFHTAILPSRPAIYFYDTGGQLVDPASVVDIAGDLEVTEDGALTVQTEMEPLGVLTISTHGQGELVSGSVRVVSDGPIAGMLRFEHPALGVAGVGASPPVSDAFFPVRRQEGGITTGVALHNLESSPGLLRCDLMREGVLLDAVSIPLEANGQTAWLIDQAFPAADTSDFAGSVRCDAVGEGLFTAVALEMDPGNRIFTTLPVVPVPEMPSQE